MLFHQRPRLLQQGVFADDDQVFLHAAFYFHNPAWKAIACFFLTLTGTKRPCRYSKAMNISLKRLYIIHKEKQIVNPLGWRLSLKKQLLTDRLNFSLLFFLGYD